MPKDSHTFILLVDDEKFVLDALRQQIREAFGSEVECESAEHADEAWEVLEEVMDGQQGRVILIVSDWLMPQVRGDELLENVRARYPGIFRVMLTGQADQNVLERIEREGVVDKLLFKPWSAQALEETVRSALVR